MDDASHRQDTPHGPLRSGPSARDRISAAVRGRGSSAAVGAPAGVPRLPADEGLEPVRSLGGEAWLVQEARSGERFVLHLCSGASAPERERSWARARALAVGLAGCVDPHVVAVRGLLGPAAEPVGVVEEYLPGGTLADRLAGPVRPGPAQVGPVLRDAAAGLAVLHGRGRCHGALTARQVLFRAPWDGSATDGADVPPPAALRPGLGTGSSEEDVRALGAMAWSALTGRAPGEGVHRVPLSMLRPDAPPGLVRAVEAALTADPAGRPGAAELAARFARCAEEVPAPVDAGTRRAHAARERSGRRSFAARERAGRRTPALLAVGGVALLSAVAVLLGPAGGPDDAPGRAPAGPSAAAPAVPLAADGAASPRAAGGESPGGTGAAGRPGGPRAALAELVSLRGAALRTGNARLLDQVYAPGAPPAAADHRLLERVEKDQREVFAELELSVGEVRDVARGAPAGPRAVVYEADVVVDGYAGEPGGAQAVVATDGSWVQTVEVVVVRTDQGWRLGDVAPVPAGERNRVPGGDTGRGPDRDGGRPGNPDGAPAGERKAPSPAVPETTDPRR